MKKVLIAEDEADILEILKFRIENAGHKVISSGNGKQALAILKKETVDLIISDVLMPEMDGFQLYKELKNNPETAKIPVLILTARGKMEDSFLVMGADEFIAKPFEAEDLLAKVDKLLNKGGPSEVKAKAPVISGAAILLAGPDQETLKNMAGVLKSKGHTVQTVLGGPDVITQCAGGNPQVLVLDILMPDIPSHELVKMIRQIPKMRGAPLLLFSVEGTAGEDIQQKILSIDNAQELCMEAGATAYLGPYNENDFVKRFSKHVQ